MLGGSDIGPDGLPGTGDELFNSSGSTIGRVQVNPLTGNFDNSTALAGVQPYDYDPVTGWTMLAPAGQSQTIASFGKIGPSTLGQVFAGNPDFGRYGLFAATEPIVGVQFTEVSASGARDFDIQSSWL